MAFFLAIFMSSCLLYSKALQQCRVETNSYCTNQASKGKLFQKIIYGNDFFKKENSNDVRISVSPEKSPDLPGWLRFEQKDPKYGVLFGTPGDKASNTRLLVIALNKDTYATKTTRMMVEVIGETPNTPHHIELRIKNKDWNDLLTNNDHFLTAIREIWQSASSVSHVARPIQRNDFSIASVENEGVYVSIGGDLAPSKLLMFKENCKSVQNDTVLNKGYDVDWCSLTDLNHPNASKTTAFPFDANSHFFPMPFTTTKYDPSKEDLTLDIIYMFIAVFIGLILIIVLTIIMCFNREGLEQRNKLTPKEQLQHHTALRRAGAQLRNMPTNKGFPYGKLDDDSRAGTLSSKKTNEKESSSPPPYGYGNDPVKRQDSKF